MPPAIRSCFIAAALAAQLAAQSSATISPVQTRYAVGEPVDLILTLDNQTDGLALLSPVTHRSESAGGLEIIVSGQKTGGLAQYALSAWPDRIQDPVPDPPRNYISSRLRYIGTSAKQRTATKLLLNRFCGTLPAGKHHVEYTVDVRVLRGSQKTPIIGHGSFDITVFPAVGPKLDAALARHLSPPDSRNYYEQMAYRSGLFLIASPIVIPYLIQLTPQSQFPDPVLAMAKFRGNHDAKAFVLGKLTSDDPNQIADAISVLDQWQYAIPESDIARLLNHGSTESRLAAMRYLYHHPGRTFRADIKALGDDPDTVIAAASQRIQARSSTLSRRGGAADR